MTTSLGQELRRLRIERNLKLDDVAKGTGITVQYLSMLETGVRKSISFEIMTSISKFYQVPLDYFTIFLNDDDQQEKEISDAEILLWQAINEKIRDDIFYKNGKTIRKIFPKLFQKK